MAQLMDRVTERLVVKFTKDQKVTRGLEIAELLGSVAELKDDIKSMKKGMEAQIAEKEARINKLSEEIRAGQEYKSVDCVWVYEWEHGKRHEIRMDTNEIIKEEDISDEERQTKLDLDTESQGEATPDPGQPVEASTEAAQEELTLQNAEAEEQTKADIGKLEEEPAEAEEDVDAEVEDALQETIEE